MLSLANEKRSALLCYERDPAHCHRTLLVDAVAAGSKIVDLCTAAPATTRTA